VDEEADLFKAIGDATRRIILDELTEHDGQTLFEICGRLTHEARPGLLSTTALRQAPTNLTVMPLETGTGGWIGW
jgi:hypothetical protein